MKTNVGTTDKIIRVILGLVIIAAGAYLQTPWNGWWGAIGIVPLLTAIIGFCPAYLPLGISTCPSQTATTEINE